MARSANSSKGVDVSDFESISSDNLATPARTIAGVLRAFHVLELERDCAEAILGAAGLPARALEQPDFAISLDVELAMLLSAIRRLEPTRSPTTVLFERRARFGLRSLGVLGMAMRHAPTVREAYAAMLEFPGLSWGHTRLIARPAGEQLALCYVMASPIPPTATPEEAARLTEFCTVMDLVSGTRNVEDLVHRALSGARVTLPFARPHDWGRVAGRLPYPVEFGAHEAAFLLPADFHQRALPEADDLAFAQFVSAARRLSDGFSHDVALSERVVRILWAQCPAPSRGEVAQRLGLSERSLTRRLAAEGGSYASLLAQVQVERAQTFLRARTLSIAEIGYRMGYSDPAAFSRAFTGWTGLPPSTWRERL